METKTQDWNSIMTNTPGNESAVDAFEADIVEVILKHRAEDGISALDVGGQLINILFTIATTQPDPKVAVESLKMALDDVYKSWESAEKPDILKGMIERCLSAKVSDHK